MVRPPGTPSRCAKVSHLHASSRIVVIAEMALLSVLGYFAPGRGESPVAPRSAASETRHLVPRIAVPAAATIKRGEAISGRSYAAASPAVAEISHRYETATDKRALFEELRDSGTAESLYFAAEILEDCFDVGEHGFEAVVNAFLDKLPIDSPTTTKQVESFRRLVEPCAGFDGRLSSPAEIQLLYAAGAQRGDPRAIGHLLTSAGIDSAAVTVQTAAVLLELSDPHVIGEVSSYLAGLFVGGMVLDGARLNPSENGPVTMAWALVACDYGASCGATHPAVLQACARGGLCGIESLDELFRLTYVPVETYQRGQAYRARILAA